MRFGRHDLLTERHILLSPAGAGIAIICFFLPWGRFSCAGLHKSVSGADLGGSFWLVFWAALVLLVAGGLLVFSRRERMARGVVLACSAGAFWILVHNAIRLSRGLNTPLGHIRPQDVGVSPRPGGVGTLLGFLLAAAGSFLLRPAREPVNEPSAVAPEAPKAPDDRMGAVESRT